MVRSLGLMLLAQTVFTTGTQLVVIPVTVTDRNGQLVAGLTPGDFRIEDEGTTRPIDVFSNNTPASILLVVDRSASMQPRTAMTLDAVQGFLSEGHPDDEVLMLPFAERPDGQSVVDRPEAFHDAIVAAPAAGGTAVFDVLVLAARLLERGRHQRRVVVLASDGDDTESRSRFTDAEAALLRAGLPLYILTLHEEPVKSRSGDQLRRLARASGGYARQAASRDQARESFRQLRSDLRRQYILGFTSAASGRSPRRLRVTVVGRNLVVRARDSYLPGK